MTLNDTFNKLKQTPISDMNLIVETHRATPLKIPPMYQVNNMLIDRDTYYPDILKYRDLLTLLREHGWEFEDYCLALEKKAIIEQVEMCNASTELPVYLIDRAREFFPNLKLTQARIELE